MNAHGSQRFAIFSACGLLLAAGAWLALRRTVTPSATRHSTTSDRSSNDAFHESYLNAARGLDTTRRRACKSCHGEGDIASPRRFNFLTDRAELSRGDWSSAIPLSAKCGACHLVPDPSNLPGQSWRETLSRMAQIMETRRTARLTDDEFQDILHFYFTFSAETPIRLASDPDARESPLRFEPIPLGNPPSADSRERPFLGHVQIADLDHDGRSDVLVCDTGKSSLTWIHNRNGLWKEDLLGSLRNPGRAQILAGGPNDRLAVVAGCLGATVPTDDPVGSVVLLSGEAPTRMESVTLLDQISRVADVQPGDFDGDGDRDFVVAAYGFIEEGEVGWLEKRADGAYFYHRVARKTGAVNVLPLDLNADGRLDFVALFAQEHEEIAGFINAGNGEFQERLVFKAATPSFGSSSIRLADLDQDGDADILYTNGDNLDLPTIVPRPYHGVQWLENQGNLNFAWHDIYRCYGAYSAMAGDLNKDGHLDIVVTTLFNDWSDPKRASLLWFENNGRQKFTSHTIATRPTHLISSALGDLDGDGWLDIVACGIYTFPPFDRMGRVTLWKNRGTRK
jgi:hypothetical protein